MLSVTMKNYFFLIGANFLFLLSLIDNVIRMGNFTIQKKENVFRRFELMNDLLPIDYWC